LPGREKEKEMIDEVAVGATSTLIVKANVKRLRQRLYLVNNSAEDMSVAPGSVAIAGYGIILVAGGGAFTDQPDPTGYIYQGVYTAICASGAMDIAVTELNKSG